MTDTSMEAVKAVLERLHWWDGFSATKDGAIIEALAAERDALAAKVRELTADTWRRAEAAEAEVATLRAALKSAKAETWRAARAASEKWCGYGMTDYCEAQARAAEEGK